MKMVLKGCPRCGGDLFPDREASDGHTLWCLQCGLDIRIGERPRPLARAALRQGRATGPRAA